MRKVLKYLAVTIVAVIFAASFVIYPRGIQVIIPSPNNGICEGSSIVVDHSLSIEKWGIPFVSHTVTYAACENNSSNTSAGNIILDSIIGGTVGVLFSVSVWRVVCNFRSKK